MYIKKLILENYTSIFIGMKCNKITIDFSKRKNRICLLVAPNGTGKTSILSALTPFASLGNLDVRDATSIILEGEKGYKEIEIVNGKDDYIIKHFYTPTQKSHTVKSFIMKNGSELNSNGNVTSFKEIVKNELDIEMDYLKLIRLGSNVTNLLDLKATERKAFMSKLLDDTEIYLKYYKQISKQNLELNTLMKHTLDKINRTGIRDLETSEKQVEELEEKISSRTKILHDARDSLAVVSSKIEELPDQKNLIDEIRSFSKQLDKIKKTTYEETNLDTLKENEKIILDSIAKYAEQLTKEKVLYETKYTALDSYYQEKEKVEEEISKEMKESNIVSLKNIISDLEYKVENLKPLFKDKEYPLTKKELSDLMVFLQTQEDLLQTTYSFGEKPMQKVLMLKKNPEIQMESYLKKSLENAENNSLEDACRVVYEKILKEKEDRSCPASVNHCGYISIYEKIVNCATSDKRTKQEDSVFMIQCIMIVNENLNTIFSKFKEHNHVFDRLPLKLKSSFSMSNITEKLLHLQPIYEKKDFNDYLSEITEYENFLELKDTLVIKKEELKKEIGKSHLSYLQSQLDKFDELIKTYKEDLENIKDEIHDLETKINNLKVRKDEYSEIISIYEKKEEIESSYIKARDTYSTILKYEEEKSKCMFEISSLEHDIQEKTNQSQYLKFQIKEYCSLMEDVQKYTKVLKEIEYIKDAWSTKSGIPSKFIQMYLKETKDQTNNLLDCVYHGDLYIKKFEINDDEFSIPFVKDGCLIDDVRYASQGELSFLSIALSFALTGQSLTRYNIMLLDEIDATLDTTNRSNFLSVLEMQNERINAEQTFLISHNNMFDTYPVDVISLMNEKDENNTLINYIDIIKE